MAGIMETLFGPDGIGGESGAVGRTLDNGIVNTALGGVGKLIAPVGNAAVGGLGDWISDVVTKNPLEILKDPISAFNDKGQLSITRLLFPDFRRQAVQQRKMAATAESLKAYGELAKAFTGAATDTGSGIQRKALIQQGLDPNLVNPIAQAAKFNRHLFRKAGKEGGLGQYGSLIADQNSAQQAVQSNLTHGFQMDEQTHGGEVTRQNQANQFGLDKRMEGVRQGNRLDVIDYSGRVGAARDKYSSELRMWEEGQKTGGVKPDPYPLLKGLYDDGAFRDNPDLERLAGFQIANPTDKESASRLLTGYTDTLVKPAGQQGTMTERRDAKLLRNLKSRIRSNTLPPDVEKDARLAWRSGDAVTGRDILRGSLKRKFQTPPDGDWRGDATRLVANQPEFLKLVPDPDTRAAITAAVTRNDNAPLKMLMPLVYKKDMGAAKELLANPEYRKINERSAALVEAKAGLGMTAAAAEAPGQPNTVDQSLFGPYISRLSHENQLLWAKANGYGDDWVQRKQALWTTATAQTVKFLRDTMGGHASDQDRVLIFSAWPTGDEPSAQVFAAKVEAVNRANDRIRQFNETQGSMMADAIRSGEVSKMGGDALEAAYLKSIAADLARDLQAVSTDPENMPDVPLTPEQRARLGQ